MSAVEISLPLPVCGLLGSPEWSWPSKGCFTWSTRELGGGGASGKCTSVLLPTTGQWAQPPGDPILLSPLLGWAPHISHSTLIWGSPSATLPWESSLLSEGQLGWGLFTFPPPIPQILWAQEVLNLKLVPEKMLPDSWPGCLNWVISLEVNHSEHLENQQWWSIA